MAKPLYPQVSVKLTGKDGNSFAILGEIKKAMRKASIEDEEIDKFYAEAMEDDYDHLLRTCMKYVNVK